MRCRGAARFEFVVKNGGQGGASNSGRPKSGCGTDQYRDCLQSPWDIRRRLGAELFLKLHHQINKHRRIEPEPVELSVGLDGFLWNPQHLGQRTVQNFEISSRVMPITTKQLNEIMHGNEQCSQDRQGTQRSSPTAQGTILLHHFSYKEPQGYGDESYTYRGPVIPESENVQYRLNHCGLKYCNKPHPQKKKRCAQHFCLAAECQMKSAYAQAASEVVPITLDRQHSRAWARFTCCLDWIYLRWSLDERRHS
jgi:hypothetical protein